MDLVFKKRNLNIQFPTTYILLLALQPLFLLAASQTLMGQAWQARHRLSSTQYQREFDKWTGQGYRPTVVDGDLHNGADHYAAVWVKQKGQWRARHGQTLSQFESQNRRMADQNFFPICISGFALNGSSRYAAIWESRSDATVNANPCLTSAEFQSEFERQVNNGFRLTWIDGYSLNGKAYYSAIFERATGKSWYAHHELTASAFQQKFDSYFSRGFLPEIVSGYSVDGQARYAAIWSKKYKSNRTLVRHGLSHIDYQKFVSEWAPKGFRLEHVSGFCVAGEDRYAAIMVKPGSNAPLPGAGDEINGISKNKDAHWRNKDINHIDSTITNFMRQHQIPGVGIAIAKNGRLVFSKGYGIRNEDGDPVRPNSLFRIASVSKPITATAIMKLVEENKLRLDDRLFGPDSVFGNRYGKREYDTFEKSVTVRNLLEHTAGGSQWNNKGRDGSGPPMFEKLNFSHEQLIGWVLDDRVLGNQPGRRYDYSNFGYCLLGRVIEAKSGLPYEEFVRKKILAPSGVSAMRIAKNLKSEAYANEVEYFGAHAYQLNVKRMDAHGGWLASAEDLVRFLVHVDGFDTKPDVLSEDSVATMTQPGTTNSRYAKGWAVNSSKNWWHTGRISGSGAIAVRTRSGYCWALVMNTTMVSQADAMIWKVVNGVERWPEIDLFEKRFASGRD